MSGVRKVRSREKYAFEIFKTFFGQNVAEQNWLNISEEVPIRTKKYQNFVQIDIKILFR